MNRATLKSPIKTRSAGGLVVGNKLAKDRISLGTGPKQKSLSQNAAARRIKP